MNAFAATNYDGQQIYDHFAEEATEHITLDGVNYRIDYSYQDELRVIKITSCATAQENILTYSPHSDEMLLNDMPIADFSGSYAPQADGEWTLVSSETYKIEWGSATFPFQPIQYMYEWTFAPWTGDAAYGPFRISSNFDWRRPWITVNSRGC